MSAPLAGVNVLDLSWVMVGPASGRYLADTGADVIKVESSKRIDPVRTLGPFKDGKAGPERSVSYHNLNAGKRCIAIDIRRPEGREIILRLAQWADVVLESFTPGVLETLHLGYPDLRRRNERIIMASTSLLGQTGPYAQGTSGVGTMGAAMSGATYQIGWPDREPAGPFGPWTDAVTPRFIVASILAALHRRSRTGTGSYIDVAQAEAGIQFMLPAYYECAANGAIPERRGVAGSPLQVPQGLFRCSGEDRWIAIDASAPNHWEALRAVIAEMCDARFDTIVGRMRNRAELEAAISKWTRAQEAAAVEHRLQAAGVPAHVVSRSGDFARDVDLREAGHLHKIIDPVFGEAEIEGPRFSLERTPLPPTRRGPRIGEHTKEVLATVLGMSESEIAQLSEAGLLA
ncbi:CaiB/BaiF CoA transferase family protein [Candidatus Binatus sp.]|uniref:CaiB/BaiF CoA transferase family protein n=1 Tax=Candidatus Binatus sp. TaxID=2811406 RepID=UPI003C8A1A4B